MLCRHADDEDAKNAQGQEFEFIDHAPLVFAHIRALGSITTESYKV